MTTGIFPNVVRWSTTYLQAPLSVVDDNRKVVGALSVGGATIVKIVSKFQYYFPDFLKKIRISVNQLGFPGIPAKFREIFTEKWQSLTKFQQNFEKIVQNPERS